MGKEQKLLGLIGYPLSHSFSRVYFQKKFSQDAKLSNYDYLNFPVKHINELNNIIAQHPQLIGFNVTIPYKEQILDFLDATDEIVKKVKAVNTVKVVKEDSDTYKLFGYNTDAYGFEQSILPFLKRHHNKALILGTGGASKAVAYVFNKLEIDYLHISRSTRKSNIITYADLNKKIMDEYRIIVNTTPVGMYPNIHSFPAIPYKSINHEFLCYDLVYNPDKTQFLIKAEEMGASIVNGYQMLVYQAEKAWEIFTENNF
ncbi:MAG: shikimate dehydrogenase [Bacteroidales bacterium]|nr:shikimate dehydrogenase [Bacteroidales bacterium]